MAEITQIDLGLVVGDTGATGATGPTGPQGPGATISVGSVTTTTYGNPAQVNNSGTATDAVLDFVIPQGAPGEEVTDVSSLTLNSITETAASFPVPAVGDVMSVVMGKVKKFFADTVAALNTKLNKSNVVNDLTYTTEGYALDARAGKTLKTQIDSLNDSFTAEINAIKNASVLSVTNLDSHFTISNSALYKSGRVIFGSIVLRCESAFATGVLFNLGYTLPAYQYMMGGISAAQWEQSITPYRFYVGSTGNISLTANVTPGQYVSISVCVFATS